MTVASIKSKHQGGYLLIMVMVFSSVLFTIITSTIGFATVQSRLVTNKVQYELAGQIAEAGLNYYKWYLAHHPNDTTHGTGAPGPYVFTYFDPEGAAIGEYALTVNSTQFCGETHSIRVESVGSLYANPSMTRTMSARYSRPTVADYAFILNSSVWAGPDRVITGPYHSNGGIRMDGQNDSTVTSNLANWTCTGSFGCTPDSNRTGVFTTTANANPALFDFPSPPVNFAGITVDLATIKSRAQTGGGLYYGPSGGSGYRVTFNTNGTVTVRRVNSTISHPGFTTANAWQTEQNIINNTTVIASNVTIPASCPVLFFEDKVWLEGTLTNKVTLGVGNLITPSSPHSMILQGNINYSSATSSGLLAIAQQNILIGVDVPDTMNINGIFIAQNGYYGRNMYCGSIIPSTQCNSNARLLPTTYRPFAMRAQENMNGTIVSNGRVGTQWTSGGATVSGFLSRVNTYDRLLAADPPPFTPATSDVYLFQEWRDGN